MAKNEIWTKKFFREIDLLDFTIFFWPGLFLIFWPTVNKKTDGSNTTNGLLSCYICSKMFKTRKKLNSHYKIKHGKTCLKCDYCVKVFVDKLRLSQHIGKAHKDFIPEKEVKCHYCPEIFRTPKLRSSHESESHADLRKTCDLCQVECRDIKFLANHIALKHCLKNSKKQSVCMYCNIFKR